MFSVELLLQSKQLWIAQASNAASCKQLERQSSCTWPCSVRVVRSPVRATASIQVAAALPHRGTVRRARWVPAVYNCGCSVLRCCCMPGSFWIAQASNAGSCKQLSSNGNQVVPGHARSGCAQARPGDRLDTGRCCLTTPSHCAQCALCTCCHSVFSSVWNGGAGSKNGEPRWPQSKISVTVTIIKDGQSLTAGREEQDRAKRVV